MNRRTPLKHLDWAWHITDTCGKSGYYVPAARALKSTLSHLISCLSKLFPCIKLWLFSELKSYRFLMSQENSKTCMIQSLPTFCSSLPSFFPVIHLGSRQSQLTTKGSRAFSCLGSHRDPLFLFWLHCFLRQASACPRDQGPVTPLPLGLNHDICKCWPSALGKWPRLPYWSLYSNPSTKPGTSKPNKSMI